MSMNEKMKTMITDSYSRSLKHKAREIPVQNSYCMMFYMMFAYEDLSNHAVSDESSEFVLYCIERLEKKDRAREILKKRIRLLEKKGKLHLLPKEKTSDTFRNSDIHYKYKEDDRLNDELISGYTDDEITINLHRCLKYDRRAFMPAFINTVFFREKAIELTDEVHVSKKNLKYLTNLSYVQFLIDIMQLSEKEAALIQVIWYFHTNNALSSFRSQATKNTLIITYSHCLGISEEEFLTLTNVNERLRSYGLINDDYDLDSRINFCIVTEDISPFFEDLVKTTDCTDVYPLESYSIPMEKTELLKELLAGQKPVSVLLYGKPGTGKTEYAKSLCHAIGKKAFIMKNEEEVNSRSNVVYRLNALLSMAKSDTVFIIDEADTLLHTGRGNSSSEKSGVSLRKGTINKLLEANRNKVIWIVNYTEQIDESTRRRFSFSCHFNELTSEQLRSIARNKLNTLSIETETKEKMLDMFNRYHLTGASVENIAKVVECMPDATTKDMLRKVDMVMKENAALLDGPATVRSTVSTAYDPDVLNTSIDAEKLLSMIRNAQTFAERNQSADNGIRMLFYGLSGTGKTELARYLAEKLNKKVLLKRPSDILDQYLGESEKHLKAAFMEAADNGNILLFDEADSFFSDRQSAKYAHERQLVNEFLTQTDEFHGILICTTNMRNIMDPALQRRFHLLVEFKPLKPEGIRILLKKYFSDWSFHDGHINQLTESNSVTPGDFYSLASRIRFMDTEELSSDDIVAELKTLQAEKRKQAGWQTQSDNNPSRIGFYIDDNNDKTRKTY